MSQPPATERGRPARPIKKPLQFNILISREIRAELDHFARLGGRPISYHIEHMIALTKMLIEFCDGTDNPQVVESRLKKAREVMSDVERT